MIGLYLHNIPRFDAPALCAEADPDAFHPGKGESLAPAREVCSLCPARLECLKWAVANAEPASVWGGLTDRERRPLVREYKRLMRAGVSADVALTVACSGARRVERKAS